MTTYTMEQLGTPNVGFKLNGTNIAEHLEHNYGIIPLYVPYALQKKWHASEVNTDAFDKAYKDAFGKILSEKCKPLKVAIKDYRVDIVMANKNHDEYGIATPIRFDVNESDYGKVRNAFDSLDWDEICTKASEDIFSMLQEAYEKEDLVTMDWNTSDERWGELFDLSSKRSIDRFDAFYWEAFNKLDSMQWHNYCYQHGTDKKLCQVHPTVDFMCWCLDTQEYDEPMSAVRSEELGVRSDMLIDFDKPETRNLKHETSLTKQQNNKTTLTTPSGEGTTTMGTKPETSNVKLETTDLSVKYAANFAKMMANTNIKNAQSVTWEQNGNIVKMTAVEEQREGYSRTTTQTYDSKNKGTNQWTIEVEGSTTTRLDWRTPSMYQNAIDAEFNMSQMGKWLTKACCKKFGIEFIPTPKEERNANRGKASESKAVQAKADKRAIVKNEGAERTKAEHEGAERTKVQAHESSANTNVPTPNSSLLTPEKFAFYQSDEWLVVVEPIDSKTAKVYPINCEAGMQTPNIFTLDKVKSGIASMHVTLTNEVDEKWHKVLVENGLATIVSDNDNDNDNEKAAPIVNDAEIAAAARDIKAHAEELAKSVEKKNEQKAQTTPNSSLLTPNCNVVPMNLPDAIIASDMENGRITLSGLNNFTAEQITIFVAGMNAMREAIKNQNAKTGTDELPF